LTAAERAAFVPRAQLWAHPARRRGSEDGRKAANIASTLAVRYRFASARASERSALTGAPSGRMNFTSMGSASDHAAGRYGLRTSISSARISKSLAL